MLYRISEHIKAMRLGIDKRELVKYNVSEAACISSSMNSLAGWKTAEGAIDPHGCCRCDC